MQDFDFQKYIQSVKGDRVVNGERAFRDYAFSRDVKVLRTLDRTRIVGLALKATARLERTWLAGEVVENAVKVGPGVQPELRALSHDVARNVGMATPPLFLSKQLGSWRAIAINVDADPCVLLDEGAVAEFEDGELMFLIGQQCGHLQNGHTPYLTCQFALEHMGEAFYGWLVKPARVALDSWARLGEITADRAGLLACRDLEAAESALRKLHPEATEERIVSIPEIADHDEDDDEDEANDEDTEEVDSDEGVDAQAEKKSYTLRTRLRALRAFAQSEIYRLATGASGGDVLSDVDKEVEGSLRLL